MLFSRTANCPQTNSHTAERERERDARETPGLRMHVFVHACMHGHRCVIAGSRTLEKAIAYLSLQLSHSCAEMCVCVCVCVYGIEQWKNACLSVSDKLRDDWWWGHRGGEIHKRWLDVVRWLSGMNTIAEEGYAHRRQQLSPVVPPPTQASQLRERERERECVCV